MYAFCLAHPTEDIQMVSLGKKSIYNVKGIASVKMLGSKTKLLWKQEDGALIISKPDQLPAWQVIGFKIEYKN